MNRILIFCGLISLFLLSSCLMKKVEYFTNMSPDSLYNIKVSEALKIQPNDRLGITIRSKDAELAAPFNTDLGGYTLSTESEVIRSVNKDESFEVGYLVDKDGFITLPILGKIQVAGLSMDEVKLFVAKQLKDKNYIQDPDVKVKLLNFKIITMGTIQNSVYNVPDGKITLLEAIVKAGGLTPNSDATKVMVIREEGGERKMLVNNMEDYNVFNSESFYLQQNDIVYVAPKYKQVTPGTSSMWQTIGMVFSFITLTLTTIALINNNGK